MKAERSGKKTGNNWRAAMPSGGLAAWLLARFRRSGGALPRLRLVERIALSPRQSLALVEAEDRLLLVATSPDGAPSFFPLDERGHTPATQTRPVARARSARVTW